jgi:hypothetical protein
VVVVVLLLLLLLLPFLDICAFLCVFFIYLSSVLEIRQWSVSCTDRFVLGESDPLLVN